MICLEVITQLDTFKVMLFSSLYYHYQTLSSLMIDGEWPYRLLIQLIENLTYSFIASFHHNHLKYYLYHSLIFQSLYFFDLVDSLK